ncbi:MAG: PilZ domain-containing protein [Armatimonadetes bacterium]|nr:PilZ domain-containing protein [Armatimonadota bacterium]
MQASEDQSCTGFVKKALLFGAVLVGLPLLALGLAALLRKQDTLESSASARHPETPPAAPEESGPQPAPEESGPQPAAEESGAQPAAESERLDTPAGAEAAHAAEAAPPAVEESAAEVEAAPPADEELEVSEEPQPPEDLRQSVVDTMRLLYSEKTVDEEPLELTLRDRRQSVRLSCEVPVTCEAEGIHPATMIDISLTGFRLRSNQAYKVGQVWRTSPERARPIEALVVWSVRGDDGCSRAGLKYAESLENLTSSWVVDVLVGLGLGAEMLRQRRAWIRIQTDLQVMVKTPKDKELEGRMLDVGMGGARVETSKKLPLKGQSRLVLPGGSTRGSLSIPATVLESRKDAERNAYVNRLRFMALNKGLSTRLENALMELLQGGA